MGVDEIPVLDFSSNRLCDNLRRTKGNINLLAQRSDVWQKVILAQKCK